MCDQNAAPESVSNDTVQNSLPQVVPSKSVEPTAQSVSTSKQWQVSLGLNLLWNDEDGGPTT